MVQLRVLSDEDKDLIHQKTLEILEKTGVVVKSERIMDLMAQFGCTVEKESSIIKIPAELVEKAVKTAPEKYTLHGLDPEKSLPLKKGNEGYLVTDGQGCFVVDLETGQRRDSTMQDLIDSVVLSDALDSIDMVWPMISALDVPSETRTLRELATMYRYTGKHIQTDVFSPQQVPFFIDVLEAILGDKEHVKEQKIFSAVCCSVSPLGYDADMLEACLDLTEYDVPIEILPMPIAGATAPASLLSAALLNNIEVIAALTIFELYKPGTPIMYGSASSILDMKTGLFAVGAPEEGLINAAGAEMARYYRVPSFVCGFGSDAKEPGIQAALEKMACGITPLLAGTNILCGIGLLETCQCLFFEQLVIDDEIFGFARRIKDGIRGGKEFILSDVISEVGAGGHYLSQRSTKQLIRQGEHYIPKLISRESFEAWQKSPKKDIQQYAKEKAKKILCGPRQEYLESSVVKELAKILQSAEKVLCI